MDEIINFRDFKTCFMIDVCEGEGTEESIKRIVHYFYETNGQKIGKIDPCN